MKFIASLLVLCLAFSTGFALAQNGEDNISLQVIRINQVHRAIFFHGLKTGYARTNTVETKAEYNAGAVLDNRFEIVERPIRLVGGHVPDLE